MSHTNPECCNDCIEELMFPKTLWNRPGLSRIQYRIGVYPDILDAVLRKLDADPLLAPWTHREPDDPGIALLEGAAIVGDILTFYQEHYANEAYLRTAAWRESVADLVRLTGYILSPGVGGKTVFALEVKDKNKTNKPVTLPKGFPIKAQVKGLDTAADFETVEETVHYPAFNKFHLYRPRRPMGNIATGTTQLEVFSVMGKNDFTSIQSLDIKAGDRIMLVPDAPMFEENIAFTNQKEAEILVVSEVERVLDRFIIHFKGGTTVFRSGPVTAYRIGRTFAHAGFNAADTIVKYDDSKKEVTEIKTNFYRKIGENHWVHGAEEDFYSFIKKTDMPLDREVDDLAAGAPIICTGNVWLEHLAKWAPITIVRKITRIFSDSIRWGNTAAAATVLTLDDQLVKNTVIVDEFIDIQEIRFHEITGPEMVLRAPTTWETGSFTSKTLYFWGTYDQVKHLPGRTLVLEAKNGGILPTAAAGTASGLLLDGKDKINPWMWPVELAAKPTSASFLLDAFDEKAPLVTVYGNLAGADQGKTEKETILGNGDNREIFQSFKLPKAPLTYHNHAGETPPEVPELKIYVNDRLWKRVSTFFDKGPKEEIYIVREDSENNSWVQFGDGKTGARLPSGLENVTAVYRTGTGAYGALKDETKPQPGGKAEGLEKIHMPGVSSGGDEPETGDNAREAAPGKTLALGRLVSLRDFESEALAVPGVSKAAAEWEVSPRRSAVTLTLLMESGRLGEFSKVRGIINKYNICRGPQRFPVSVVQGKRAFIYIHAQFGLDASFKEAKVKVSIKKVLGVVGEEGNGIDGRDGLFGLRARRFGQNAYASRIKAAICNVEGVLWAKVTALESLGEAGESDPSSLTPSAAPGLSPKLICDNRRIFCLYKTHLALSVSKDETTGRC